MRSRGNCEPRPGVSPLYSFWIRGNMKALSGYILPHGLSIRSTLRMVGQQCKGEGTHQRYSYLTAVPNDPWNPLFPLFLVLFFFSFSLSFSLKSNEIFFSHSFILLIILVFHQFPCCHCHCHCVHTPPSIIIMIIHHQYCATCSLPDFVLLGCFTSADRLSARGKYMYTH